MRRGLSSHVLLIVLGLGLGLQTAGRGQDAPKAEEKPPAPPPKVVVFRLAGTVKESPTDDLFVFGGEPGPTLKTLVERMDKAAKDAQVKAVVLLCEGVQAGQAQVGELRQAIERIRAAGKDVYAHADQISGAGVYSLMAAASRVSVVPTADLWVSGLFGEAPYLRGLLDKLHVQPDFMTCGDYKSAGEIFMRYGPSKEADEMENWLLDSLYTSLVERIADGRKVPAEKVRAWVDDSPYTAEQALKRGMIDAVEPRQELESLLKKKYGENVVFDRKYGKKDEPKPDFSSPFGLFKFWGELLGASKKPETKKPAVAIVYVEGPIVVGRESASLFSENMASGPAIRKALNDAADDEAVKAVVLRVDSPGGSVVASEIILDATRRVKAKKPFVVSMGDVAGSGGYYVSCGAETVFADPASITASIGVVSGKLATTGLFDEIGVRFKAYRRGRNAGMLASGEVFTPSERKRMRDWMDEAYERLQRATSRPRAATASRSRSTRLRAAASSPAGRRSNWAWWTSSARCTTPLPSWPPRPRSTITTCGSSLVPNRSSSCSWMTVQPTTAARGSMSRCVPPSSSWRSRI